MRRHPALTYFILACAISWGAVSPLILHYQVPSAWHALGAIGPSAAAVITLAIVGGHGALREFAAGMTKWRVGTIAWLLALSPIILCGIAIAALAAIGAPLNDATALRAAFGDRGWLGAMFLASLAYGVGEEPGWRGFALPRLMQDRTAFRATVLLTVGWGIWHVPFFFYRYHLGSVGEYIGFYLGLFAGAVWLTFLYNSTGGSTLIVMVWHTVWNAAALVGAVISPQVVAVTSALIMISAIIAFRVGGPIRLSWTFQLPLPFPNATRS